MRLKFNHMGPYKREAGKSKVGGSDVTMGRIGVTWPGARGSPSLEAGRVQV